MFTNLANELGHHLAWFVVHPPAELETSKPGCRPLRIWRSPCWTATRAMQADEDNAEATYPRYTVSQYIYGYGSIPINTIFRGMNIHLPAILMFTRGTRFWHTAIYIYIYIRGIEWNFTGIHGIWCDTQIIIYIHTSYITRTQLSVRLEMWKCAHLRNFCAAAKFERVLHEGARSLNVGWNGWQTQLGYSLKLRSFAPNWAQNVTVVATKWSRFFTANHRNEDVCTFGWICTFCQHVVVWPFCTFFLLEHLFVHVCSSIVFLGGSMNTRL